MDEPDFTVVVPCYNYGSYLPQCIESVVNQPGISSDILVIDDQSTDDSASVIQDLVLRHGIRSHTNVTNLGLVGTLNVGLASALGKYIIYLSADDFLAPGTLARHARAFERHPAVGIVFGNHTRYKTGDPTPSAEAYMSAASVPADRIHVHAGDRWLQRRCRTGYNPVAAPAVALRRCVADSVGPNDPRCRHTSDLNMWLRFAAASDVAFIAGAPVAYYRKHESSLSAVSFGVRSSDLEQRWVAFEAALADHADPERARELVELARDTLVEEAVLRARGYRELGADDESDRLLEVAQWINGDGKSSADHDALPDTGFLRRARWRARHWWRRKLLDRRGW